MKALSRLNIKKKDEQINIFSSQSHFKILTLFIRLIWNQYTKQKTWADE